jgi:hypothetical protein
MSGATAAINDGFNIDPVIKTGRSNSITGTVNVPERLSAEKQVKDRDNSDNDNQERKKSLWGRQARGELKSKSPKLNLKVISINKNKSNAISNF